MTRISINLEPLELLEILVDKERLRQQVVMLESERSERTGDVAEGNVDQP